MLIASVNFELLRETRATYQKEEHVILRTVLAQARSDAGFSRRALSLRLGKHPTFIARLERGERLVEVVELLEICHILGIDPVQVILRITKRN